MKPRQPGGACVTTHTLRCQFRQTPGGFWEMRARYDDDICLLSYRTPLKRLFLRPLLSGCWLPERSLFVTDHFSTQAVHAGEDKRKPYGALTTPIVQTSTYTFQDTAEILDFMHAKAERAAGADVETRHEYGRYSNPTQRVVEHKLAALEEMWRELPKHKSSEKMQAELKKKLSVARKALQQTDKKGPAKVDPFHIPKSGAGQIALVGTPNVGKSSIVGGLTKAHVKIADYPFATAVPLPGSVPYEDVQIQLIDTPPVTAEHVPAGFPGLWRSADALIVVSDLSSDSVLEDVETCLSHLAERLVELTVGLRVRPDGAGAMLLVPGLLLANKIDVPGASDNLEMLREFFGARVRIEPLSTRDADQMARLPELLFELIHVIRVYAKPPGKKPDLDAPFVLPVGSDVHELARKVYHGSDHPVKSARIWGHSVADGQHVHLDHVLHDKDVIELHA